MACETESLQLLQRLVWCMERFCRPSPNMLKQLRTHFGSKPDCSAIRTAVRPMIEAARGRISADIANSVCDEGRKRDHLYGWLAVEFQLLAHLTEAFGARAAERIVTKEDLLNTVKGHEEIVYISNDGRTLIERKRAYEEYEVSFQRLVKCMVDKGLLPPDM